MQGLKGVCGCIGEVILRQLNGAGVIYLFFE